MTKYTIGWALRKECQEEIITKITPYILLGIIIIVGIWTFSTALWKQGRKDCLVAQYDETTYGRQISPELNEFCATKYNINFRP